MDLSNPIMMSMLRQVLTSLGMTMVTSGWMTDVQWQSIVGGILTLVSVLWSLLYHKKSDAPTPAEPKKK